MRGAKKIAALLVIVVVLGANAPVVNAAQSKKVPRVALFWFEPVPQSRIDEFRRALRDLGYIEARNIVLEHREAGGKRERLPELAAELVGLKPDIIVASSGVVIEALRNTATKIPIVMPTISDPTGGGFVANPMRPEGNITGLTNFAPELSGKRLELLKEAVPTITRVAVLWRSSPVQESGMKELEFSARSLKVRLQPVSARGPKGLDEAFQTVAKARPHALLTLPDPLFLGQRTRIAEFALRSRLPTMAGARELAEAGGLMAYGPDFSYNFRRAAVYVDKILKGAKPQDLPVENPMKFELIINLKTAKEIGVNVPPRVLMWADKVIK